MASAPLRFLHTADWQLGLRVRYIPGDAGARVRDARLSAVKRIGEVAAEQGAEFVVVAGDVFEHHGLKPATVRKAFDLLKEFPVPVYLLPGNHDPYTPDALYCSPLWKRECPDNVHVLALTDPVAVRDAAHLLPCPIRDRTVLDDPTEHLTAEFGPDEGYRIGVAHGGVREILAGMVEDEDELAVNISAETAARGRLDYLALGDWHGLFQVDDRTWYSGTPEATRFKEKDPGKVLVVELAEPGAAPTVTPVAVNGLSWHPRRAELDGEDDLQALVELLEAIPDKGDALVELRLAGTVDVEMRARLDGEVLDQARDRLRWLRVRDDDLHTVVRTEDLAEIASEGWVKEVVDALAADEAEDAQRALRLLYRLHREVER
jgi:DNA repair exonuclease SbcCD nuclease subunit